MVQSLFYNYSENNKAKNTKPIMKINYLNNMQDTMDKPFSIYKKVHSHQ